MAASIIRWERRDSADRQEMAMAAIALCRASRARGAKSSRFYWSGADAIVIFTEADNAFFDQAPTTEAAKALFALADLARSDGPDRLIDPRDGEASYRAAGR